MKYIIFLFCFLTPYVVFSQCDSINTHTVKESYFLYSYDGSSYTKYIKAPKNSPVLIVGEAPISNTLNILYNNSIYAVHESYLSPNDVNLYKGLIQKYKKQKAIDDYVEKNKSKKSDFSVDNYLNNVLKDRDSTFLATDYTSSLDKILKRSDFEKAKKNPLIIKDVSTSHPNSVGGTDLLFKAMNTFEKDIKYIYISGYPINAVKDKCYCEIRHHSNTTSKGVGPIKSMDTFSYVFDNTWYNSTIDQYIPTSIKIQYMDGSTLTMNQAQIEAAKSYSYLMDLPINLDNSPLPYGKFQLAGYGLYNGTELASAFSSIASDNGNYADISSNHLKIYKGNKLLYEFYLSSNLKTYINYSLHELNCNKKFTIMCMPHKYSPQYMFYSITISSGVQNEVFFFSLTNN